MSSGFVSGGTTDAPIERSDEWLAAQEELEATRRRKAEELRQSNGRSLFETLQANQAAKQEAFEEANKLKNQFRALDEDEIEFLDSVLESTRREEERVKRETAEGLLTFRQRQEEVDKKLLQSQQGDAVSPVEEVEEEWTVGVVAKKRKRKVEREGLRGVKLRRSSTTTSRDMAESREGGRGGSGRTVTVDIPTLQTKAGDTAGQGKDSGTTRKTGLKPTTQTIVSSPTTKVSSMAAVTVGRGLVNYRSDSEDE